MASAPRNAPVGPYMLQNLVDDLPLDTAEQQDVTVTCLESWGQNLYVGTSAHEILHLVSIPSTPNPAPAPNPVYILASRIQPQASSTTGSHFIRQIFVLPTVSKALVLSSTGLLTFYTLPEFSPAFNTKLKDVSYVGGLDLDGEEDGIPEEGSANGKAKLVMVHTKSRIRMIRVGEDPRLVKDIPMPNTLSAVRRGNIACVATNQNYALLDVENIQRIPLFPISAVADEPTAVSEPSATTLQQPEASTTGSGSVPPSSQLHPPRSSSLRERRNSSAVAARESVATASHSRSISAGNTVSSPEGRGIPRPSSGLSHLLTPETGALRAASPTGSLATPQKPAAGGGRRSPASHAPKLQISSSAPAIPPKSSPYAQPRSLKPNIASPSPEEFLLTTGTRPEDPGVGMFVNLDGDVTRGTIQFNRYPEQLIIQGVWVIAVIPGMGLQMQRWDLGEKGVLDEADRKGSIQIEGDVQVKEVLALDGTVVADAGRTLQLIRIALKSNQGDASESPEDKKRNEEEREIARRISTVESRIVVFSGRKVWTLLPCPLAVQLDSRLPSFSEENFDGIVARVRRVLHVLEEVQSIEPTTETQFHEVSFVRQKCGLLVLGELLRITQKQTADIAAGEIMIVEVALEESALDPRFIVALFGDTFEDDIVEGRGVWVYGGIKQVFTTLKGSKEIGNAFTRDVLLLLKRYLVSWRSKKGFGSVADEKEVFLTVDAALLRVLLMLDSPEYLVDKGKTVVQEGNVRTELYTLIDAGVDNPDGAIRVLEAFGRLYVLSILYSKARMYRNVLETWRRILDGGDITGEFKQGEERVKNYLLRLKEPELVEEFGCWLAARNSKLGIQVFAAEDAKVKFDPAKVIEMFREHAPHAIRLYVEYLVVEKKNSAYANELISLYLDDLMSTLSSDPTASESLQSSYESYRALESPKPTYHEFIVENSPPQGSVPWWHDRMRLLELLGGESGYDVNNIFRIVEKHRDVLVPEMVILYGRSSDHASALKLLTHNLKDFDTAINYCLFGGLSIFQTRTIITERKEQCELFTILLDEYLKLEDISERVGQTSSLLEKFGGWLDVMHVLSVIPDSWSIEILKGFLISALRQLVREKADVRVERALGRSKNLRVEARFVEACDEVGPAVDVGN